MYNWFECKISYDKVIENGSTKRVTEPYLVDALSFTEAEARIIEEIRPYISGEFVIADIKRAKLSELFFNENGDRFFKAKVYFITLDEKSGAEKKTSATMLAQASDIKEALSVVEKGMEGTLADYVIASLTETAIMDVFPYGDAKSDKIEVEFEGRKLNIDRSTLAESPFELRFSDIAVIFSKNNLGYVSKKVVDSCHESKPELVGKFLYYETKASD